MLTETDLPEIGALISDFKGVADECAALGEMFTCAAARLTVVDAKLV